MRRCHFLKKDNWEKQLKRNEKREKMAMVSYWWILKDCNRSYRPKNQYCLSQLQLHKPWKSLRYPKKSHTKVQRVCYCTNTDDVVYFKVCKKYLSYHHLPYYSNYQEQESCLHSFVHLFIKQTRSVCKKQCFIYSLGHMFLMYHVPNSMTTVGKMWDVYQPSYLHIQQNKSVERRQLVT